MTMTTIKAIGGQTTPNFIESYLFRNISKYVQREYANRITYHLVLGKPEFTGSFPSQNRLQELHYERDDSTVRLSGTREIAGQKPGMRGIDQSHGPPLLPRKNTHKVRKKILAPGNSVARRAG